MDKSASTRVERRNGAKRFSGDAAIPKSGTSGAAAHAAGLANDSMASDSARPFDGLRLAAITALEKVLTGEAPFGAKMQAIRIALELSGALKGSVEASASDAADMTRGDLEAEIASLSNRLEG